MPADLSFATIVELGRMIRSGATSPTQFAEHALQRLDTIGRELNAVVALTPELAMAQARQAEDELGHGVDRGPLHGIPYGAKDLLAVAGYPTTWGAAPFRDQVFTEDAEAVRRLREAGAVLVAKLAMVECAGGFGYEQTNASFTGPGRSAWNPAAWSGGSSSGSGSAVGSGCVPFAIGSETWGSIHVPAAFNGITGFRPTYGRVSRKGAMALSWSMDKIGPLCHTAEDCQVVYWAITGADPADPTTLAQPEFDPPDHRRAGFRFAVLQNASTHAQSEVAANFAASLQVLGEIGDLETVSLPDYPMDEAAGLIIEAEAAAAFEDFILDGRPMQLTAPEDRVGLHAALQIPAVDYLRALRIRRLAGKAMEALMSQFDAIIAPTLPYVAIPLEDHFEVWSGKEHGPSLGGAGNLCGLPSISLPNGFGERSLPTSLELMGRAWSEATLFTIARRYQELTGWHRLQP